MTKQSSYREELNLRKEKIENLDISSLVHANFDEEEHKMLIGEDVEEFYGAMSEEQLFEIFQLEKVDLIDYWNNCEYGRTDKKR